MKTNVELLLKVGVYLNESYGVISDDELKEYVLNYFNKNLLSYRQLEFLKGYVDRHEIIPNSFAWMYSENIC